MSNIKCPTCATVIDVENVLSADAEQKMKQKFDRQLNESLSVLELDKKKLAEELAAFEVKKKKENEIFQQKLQQEKQKIELKALQEKQDFEIEIRQQVRQSVAGDFENKVKMLEESCTENEKKLKMARAKEMEYLQKERELLTKEAEMDLTLQQQLTAGRASMLDEIRKEEANKNALKETQHSLEMRELKKKLEDQHALVEEMKRKHEQGSMQLQGEAQELLLEELLRGHFSCDHIGEVGKGVEGADCIQTVRNNLGVECGTIIFESKRAKSFNNAWVTKLKNDMRNKQAEVAILVTGIYPKDMACFGERDGVWICSFSEVVALTTALRHTIIRIAETKKAEENKGEKMQMLYSFLTGTEFRQQIETIVEGFLYLKNAINKERIQMEKNWKEREKQLEKVLISTSGMYGSIKGIAGSSIRDIPLLEDGFEDEDEAIKLGYK